MIRVLHIHTLPIISGSGINTFLTMKGMVNHGFKSELACAPGGRLIKLVQDHHMKVTTFDHFVQPLHPLDDPLALMALIRFLKRDPYHIVHTHNSKAGFLGRLAAKIAGIPVIVHTVHGFAFHDEEPLWRRTLYKYLEKLAAYWCHKMIFISQPLIDWALREGITDEGKIKKIYSGIELEQFRPLSEESKNKIRKKWKIREEEAVIGIVSKLWEGKGHAVLIEALKVLKKELKDVKLVIVGEGYLYDDLLNLVYRLGLQDSVLFTGFMEDVSELIGTFDVAVLPSFFEGMGRVLLEAMAMKKPVVASRVGGIPDLVEDGVNGFLVPPGDPNQLAEAIMKILKDKKLAGKMGGMGRKRITEKFSADIMAASIEEVYRELLSEKGVNVGV